MNILEEAQVARERVIIAIYTFYTAAMTVMALFLKWGSWIPPVILAGLAVCIAMYFKKYKTYEYRAFVTTLMMWMNFSIYLIKSDRFLESLSTMTAMIILLAIYCIPKLTYIGAAVYTVHLLYQLVFAGDVIASLERNGLRCVLRIASVYVALYVTYWLVKNQVESNAALLENIETVRKAEQSKDDFMANMSHEIRTPINTVCGISEMVLREDLSEAAREGVYDIQTAGRQLLSLVSDILDFSELSSGKMEIVPDTYNITSTVNDLLNMAVAKAAGKDIELIVDCDADIPLGLVGDEQKIRRAVMNVLDNAIKFTEEGGVLFSVAFRKEEYGGNLIITVQDTGIGIKEEMLETLFRSFSQVDTRRNRQVSGMGLGLSIAKVIVNRMGGFISAKSIYGKGTEIEMVFPQKVNNTAPVAVVNNPGKCKVMLYLDVEKYNNALVRDGYVKSIRHMVEQLGTYYRHSRSLAECKRRLEQEEFQYLFVSWKEYCEDKEYFETLSKQMNVVLILERDHKESIQGSHLLCVYKPFYVLTIASVLNGQYVENIGRHAGREKRFIAPDARVLVVDDNLMNLKVVEGLLRPYRLKVFVAESGKEALEKIEGERFDIVFMDHMMPEMDGIETFHRIRQKPGNYFQNVPIVALTANAIGGAREMFLQEGFADYVSKPIELSTLERVLYKYIPESKLVKAPEEYEESLESAGKDTKDRVQRRKPGEDAKTNRASREKEAAMSGMARREDTPVGDSGHEEEELQLEGIDTKTGLRYCGGNFVDYLDIIRTYHQIGTSKKEGISTCLAAQDWKGYTTLVHAVKSTSLGIGAVRLSEMAKELEAAGKKEDTAYISAHTEEMLSEYERVLGVIGANRMIFPEEAGGEEEKAEKADAEGLREIEKEELAGRLGQIEEQLQSFDEEGSMTAMKELYGCSYGGKALKELLLPVEEKIGDFDFMGAQEEFAKRKEELL